MEVKIPVIPDFSRLDMKPLEKPAVMNLYLLPSSDALPSKRMKPMVLVCPGGGYAYTSDREAEPIAAFFMSKGMHAGVLRYHVSPEVHDPVPVLELAWAVQYLRIHAEELCIACNMIYVIGFSAGGHLAAHLCTRFKDEIFTKVLTSGVSWKPDAQILSYPVITMGSYTHAGSRDNLLGENADAASIERLSMERHVHEDVPPTFIWHTAEDGAVPVENSLMYAAALRKAHVPFELHVFERGGHGLSTCLDITSETGKEVVPDNSCWMELTYRFLKRRNDC